MSAPTVATVQVRPRSDARHQLVTETWTTEPPVPIDEYADHYGNPVKRFVMPVGELGLKYDAIVSVPDEQDPDALAAPQLRVEDIPGDVLHFTLPSRYCLSDQLLGMAWELFGQTEPSGARVQAVCDWVHGNITFEYGASSPLTTAVDVLEQRKGVCRDFAHLAITFCRALNIPARYVFGYLPDLYVEVPPWPMDFAAWMEVYLGD
ncbi:MAG TPA: transglutaminase family protein, partial [Candidatus Dormibacteraeota bacterium]|nr:transglutaminase family protein [Candidatus Dormibacteraeota bacterium]